ncbi:MAG: hypothetical protein WC784_06705 [Candidatus Shapirobacteria bacterium]|jgi:hypothetical protein
MITTVTVTVTLPFLLVLFFCIGFFFLGGEILTSIIFSIVMVALLKMFFGRD